ncbi:APC family permease [Leifsonia poae]|uniref:APC family permease n=1 Tax=Leifsonia poae TaxID=110933 RepID=UPI001CC0A050|nr:APC family permease [Leifsonia poae]
MSETTTTAPPADAGLRRGAMGGAELVAQAIANIAPSAVIAFTAAAIFVTAGNGTWVSFALATVIILAVGYCISQFAKRRASAGSLYNYAAAGLGPFGAFLTGVTLVIGCFGIAAGSLSGSVIYLGTVLNQLGVPISGVWGQILLAIVLGGLAALFTMRGVRLSARVSLVLEIVSVTIITVLLIIALVHAGPAAFDPAQFALTGAAPQGVAVGMVLAILGFVGFSSADALGREARNPFKAIPRAIMWSALGVGVLYVFAAYTQVAVLGDKLGTSASPLDDIAHVVGMPGWFSPVLNLGVAASFFAVVVAPLNVIGRIVYVMGKEGVAPRMFGATHERNLTPHRALLTFAPLVVAVPVVLYLFGVDANDVLVWVDTFGTFGYMVAYAAVAIAAPIFLRRLGVKNWLLWPCTVLAVGAMAYVFYANVFPVPAFPLNIIPLLFLAIVAIAIARYVWLRKNRPAVIAAIGTTETDVLEGIG